MKVEMLQICTRGKIRKLSNHLPCVVRNIDLRKKNIVGYCGDNRNKNFRGVKKKDKATYSFAKKGNWWKYNYNFVCCTQSTQLY
jgi:hypothetical protein